MAAKKTLYTFPNTWMDFVAQIMAQYLKEDFIVNVVTDTSLLTDFSNEYPDAEVPAYQLNESISCGKDMFKQLPLCHLCGTTVEAQIAVQEWVNFANDTIIPAARAWVFPTSPSQQQSNKQGIEAANKRVFDVLEHLNKTLAAKQFLLGEEATLADITVACSMHWLYKQVLDPTVLQSYGNLTSWFTRCFALPEFNVLGEVEQCGNMSLSVLKVDPQYVLPANVSFLSLDEPENFDMLQPNERMYLHHLSRAAWYAGLVVLLQTSPESPEIFILLQKLFSAQRTDQLRRVAHAIQMTDEQYNAFLQYAACFYSNMGNYSSFGDIKFIPDLPPGILQNLVFSSAAYAKDQSGMEKLWMRCVTRMYSDEENVRRLDVRGKGTTTLISKNCTEDDIKNAQAFLKEKGLHTLNTRLIKIKQYEYELRLASVNKGFLAEGSLVKQIDEASASHLVSGFDLSSLDIVPTPKARNHNFKVNGGDYHVLMTQVCNSLKEAQACINDDTIFNMLEAFINFFTSGSIEAFKDAKRQMMMMKDPKMACFGFPTATNFQGRGFFGGFVALVDRTMSDIVDLLKKNVIQLREILPWNQFDDQSTPPDYSAVNILTFSGREMPPGFTTPYCSERNGKEDQKKTLTSANQITSTYDNPQNEELAFVADTDKAIYRDWLLKAKKMQIALHEYLGHMSGKIFKVAEIEDLKKKCESPELVGKGYEENATFDSICPDIAMAYEECLADCVSLLMCLEQNVTSIFGYVEQEDAGNVIFANWLNMVTAGLQALEFYDKENEKWTQIHMQARFVILRWLLEKSALVEVVEGEADGQQYLKIQMKSIDEIRSNGKDAIKPLLNHLQVYRSTANASEAQKFFREFSTVSAGGVYDRYRDIVLLQHRHTPRVFVQCHTFSDDQGSAGIKSYEASAEGVIHSFVDQFEPDLPYLEDLLMLEQHKEDEKHW